MTLDRPALPGGFFMGAKRKKAARRPPFRFVNVVDQNSSQLEAAGASEPKADATFLARVRAGEGVARAVA